MLTMNVVMNVEYTTVWHNGWRLTIPCEWAARLHQPATAEVSVVLRGRQVPLLRDSSCTSTFPNSRWRIPSSIPFCSRSAHACVTGAPLVTIVIGEYRFLETIFINFFWQYFITLLIDDQLPSVGLNLLNSTSATRAESLQAAHIVNGLSPLTAFLSVSSVIWLRWTTQST